MTDTLLYSQQIPNDFYHQDTESQTFLYHGIALPTQQKPQRRLSFSTLLQKRPSLMGRKLSILSRPRKPNLHVVIPQVAEENAVDLERMDTSTSTSTEGGEDGPVTPISARSSIYYSDKRHSTTQDLETVVTTPTTNPTPLMDYSGKGYSNFYIKLSNGNWMVRVRDSNRKIIGTYEIDGSMI